MSTETVTKLKKISRINLRHNSNPNSLTEIFLGFFICCSKISTIDFLLRVFDTSKSNNFIWTILILREMRSYFMMFFWFLCLILIFVWQKIWKVTLRQRWKYRVEKAVLIIEFTKSIWFVVFVCFSSLWITSFGIY